MKKYLLKYSLEFLVIVMGISVSFWLNNWSESVKENNIEKDLVNILIRDIENKKNENKYDIGVINRGIERAERVINTWETTKKIDTTDLKRVLRLLGSDTPYFNAISPIYNSLSNTKLWNNLPYELVNEINDLYRMRYQELKLRFEKFREIGTYCKLHFLLPNDLIDLNRDLWQYISMDYFKQQIKEGEVGSSAMPHKVNPIDFENSEGNLGMANAIFEFLSAKLPISRLQRDLTDSTVLRNIGVPFGHTIIGLQSTFKGLGKLLVNTTKIEDDLNANWAVVAEAVQTILRKEGYPNPYEALKELTRTNTIINRDAIQQFIAGLDVDESLKAKLKTITPFNYTGI